MQKKPKSNLGLFRIRVGEGGLEPPTSSLSGMRSSRLSYSPAIHGLAKY